MRLDLDVTGRRVVVLGTAAGSRRVVRRYVTEGANVVAALDGTSPRDAWPDAAQIRPMPDTNDHAALLDLVGPSWLIALVDPPAHIRDRVQAMARTLSTLVVSERPADDSGSVTLIGGGPGRTSLLTLEALDVLRDADVVFYDRLAPRDELCRLAPAAELVDVGKSPYHHPVSQPSIERQLVDCADQGLAVVRLKGGDPFVFGRGGEELRACLKADIPVRVIPGVSSAIAVPGAAGVPVTHRGISHAFTVISGHVPLPQAELHALAGLGGTIVILMGMATLQQTVAGLISAGLCASTPAAVIEHGFSDRQRTVFETLAGLPPEVRRRYISSPAVVVIGEVVRLGPLGDGHDQQADLHSLAAMFRPAR
jgi:uroporphyrin-III C-methyltransferase